MSRLISGDIWFDATCAFGTLFHVCDAAQACYFLALQPPDAAFNYVATPNVDHLVRLHRDYENIAPLYSRNLLTSCDSRIVAMLARLAGKKLLVAPGSDISRILFDHVIDPRDPVTIIGGEERTIQRLVSRYGLKQVSYYNPPMGFINSEEEICKCIDFVVAHPARYHFFAVGSPQQEMLANRVKETGRALGTGICIGSGIDFVAGVKPRAPVWLQKLALEWLYRLATEPRRLWRRYLLDDIEIFSLWVKEMKGHSPGQRVSHRAVPASKQTPSSASVIRRRHY